MPDASYLEVKNAYLRLKRLYSTDSPIIMSISGEFPKRKKTQILKKIETAYVKLSALMEHEKKKKAEASTPAEKNATISKPERTAFNGQILRDIRCKLGLKLYDVVLETKIRKDLLKDIETERFDALPPEAYLRAHLTGYAKCLGLNPRKVTEDYLIRLSVWKQEQTSKP